MTRPDLGTIWSDLSSGLKAIYADGGQNQNKLPPQRHMELYTRVFNFCTQSVGAAELYNKLNNFITDYARELLLGLNDKHGENLLHLYTSIWKNYKFGSIVVNGVFSYLNRNWIRRDENVKNGALEVYNLAIYIWKHVIFDELHHNITAAILSLIEQHRNGEMIETKLIKRVVESYIELGINEHDGIDGSNLLHAAASATTALIAQTSVRPSAKYQIYREFFVKPLLEQTQNYYTTESIEFLQNYSVPEYIKKIEDRLKEEIDRCQLYLDHTTLDSLRKTCGDALISKHLELFYNEFDALLSNRQTDHLGRMYDFSSCCCAGAFDKLKQVFETYVVREGRAAITQVAQNAINDPKQYITAIFNMYEVYNGLVVTAFKQDHGFVESMDRAFTQFVNENEITRLAKSASKSPQVLVLYCDQLLQKSAKNVQDEKMDEYLDQVMTVFKYIEDKDMFQAFYHKMLCKRLVTGSSASEETECSMIAKLKHMCGFEYTRKLERLLTDVAISRDNIETFKRQNNNQTGVDFSVVVVMSNIWPLTQAIKFEIPVPLKTCIEDYKNYYSGKYTGRKLNWVLQMSRGELTSIPRIFDQKYSFLCNTQQISVLMLYNQRDDYRVAEITTLLNLQREQLVPVINSLVKVNLLSTNGPITAGELAEDNVLSLNAGFSNKKLKVDLIRAIVTGKELKKDSDEVQITVDEDRKIVIQATIVRIMKMRKSLKHQQLIGEVLNQLRALFQPKIPLIKRCIDFLIEKEYLKRSENERDSYEYLA